MSWITSQTKTSIKRSCLQRKCAETARRSIPLVGLPQEPMVCAMKMCRSIWHNQAVERKAGESTTEAFKRIKKREPGISHICHARNDGSMRHIAST